MDTSGTHSLSILEGLLRMRVTSLSCAARDLLGYGSRDRDVLRGWRGERNKAKVGDGGGGREKCFLKYSYLGNDSHACMSHPCIHVTPRYTCILMSSLGSRALNVGHSRRLPGRRACAFPARTFPQDRLIGSRALLGLRRLHDIHYPAVYATRRVNHGMSNTLVIVQSY